MPSQNTCGMAFWGTLPLERRLASSLCAERRSCDYFEERFFFGRKNWSAVRIESDRKSPRLSENKKNCDDLLSQEGKLRTCHAIIFDNV